MEASAINVGSQLTRSPTWPLRRLLSDRSLLRQFKAGDDRAFSGLYTRYQNVVFAVTLGVLSSRDDAEDVVQEVFATAAKHLSMETPPDNLKAWLARVAHNRAINHLRARKQTVAITEAQERDSADGPQHLLEQRNELRDVVRNLSTLPERQRSALLLRELAGNSYSEIAAALRLEPHIVRDTIKRARVALRVQRAGENMACASARDQLAAELDHRKLSKELRIHTRSCKDCRKFERGLRSDRRAIRALAPVSLLLLLRTRARLAWLQLPFPASLAIGLFVLSGVGLVELVAPSDLSPQDRLTASSVSRTGVDRPSTDRPTVRPQSQHSRTPLTADTALSLPTAHQGDTTPFTGSDSRQAGDRHARDLSGHPQRSSRSTAPIQSASPISTPEPATPTDRPSDRIAVQSDPATPTGTPTTASPEARTDTAGQEPTTSPAQGQVAPPNPAETGASADGSASAADSTGSSDSTDSSST